MGSTPSSRLEYEYSLPTKISKSMTQQAKASGYKSIVIMKLATWSRESHGLFDYENRNTSKKLLQIIGTSSIFRTKFNDIIWFPDWDDETGLHKNEYQTKPILHFLCRNNSYWLYHNNTLEEDKQDDDPADKLWYIVKYNKTLSLEEYGFKLKQGDTIKLGRVRFKITEMHRGKYQPKVKEPVELKPDELPKMERTESKNK